MCCPQQSQLKEGYSISKEEIAKRRLYYYDAIVNTLLRGEGLPNCLIHLFQIAH